MSQYGGTARERHPVEDIVRLRQFPSVQEKIQQNAPNLFVYCSTPRPVQDMEVSGGHYGRPLYRDNVEKPEGIHSYYNISWDPRVRRGDPSQARRIREHLECEKIRKKLLEPRKRQGKSSKDVKSTASRAIDPMDMVRAANMRYARLAINNLRPKEKDAFMVDLTDELDQDELCYKGQRIGAAKVLPKVPSRKKNLVDQACQIWPADFFNFDTEIIPVLERLVGAVCYQARLEVLEETELEALKLERETFEEAREREEFELYKFRSRVGKHIEEEERQAALAAQQLQDELDGKVSISLYAGVYVKYGTEEAFNALGEEWRNTERVRKAVKGEVVDWLNDEVSKKMQLYESSVQLLDDIIKHVVSEREAQCAAAMWKEVYREQPMRIFTQDVDSPNIVPPPTPGTSDFASDEEEDEDRVSPNIYKSP